MISFFRRISVRLNQLCSKERMDQIHLGYIISFVVFVTLHKLIPYCVYVPRMVDSFLYSTFAICGALLVAYDFLTGRIPLTSRITLCMLAFLLVCCASTLYNFQFGVVSNIKTIVWTAIHLFILFASSRGKSQKQVFHEMTLVFTPFTVIWLVGIVSSLALFITQTGGYITLADWSVTEYGFMQERLFGAFTDPNVAGVLSLVSIGISVSCMYGKRGRLRKAYHILNIFCCVLYAILAGSRTTQLAGTIALCIVLTLYFFQRMDRKQQKGLIKRILCVACSAVISAAILFSNNYIHRALAYMPSVYSEMTSKSEIHKPLRPVKIDREDVGEDRDFSNQRFAIWSDALALFSKSPILGTSPRNHLAYAEKYSPAGVINQKQYSIHNGYLAVLVTTGVVGAAVFLLLIFYCLQTLYRSFFAKSSKTENSRYLPLLFIAILLATSAFPMMGLFFGNSISEVAFWLVMGYLFTIVPGQFDEPPLFLKKRLRSSENK